MGFCSLYCFKQKTKKQSTGYSEERQCSLTHKHYLCVEAGNPREELIMRITSQEIIAFILAGGLVSFIAYCIIASRRSSDKDQNDKKK